MKTILSYTFFLLLGLIFSQTLGNQLQGLFDNYNLVVSFITFFLLAIIMLFVGLEFNLDKKNIRKYKTDYLVAFTAATFPWIFTSAYLLFTQFPAHDWFALDSLKEVLFIGRFAAPTSAGILFSMMIAAGLAGTWVYKKIRILAIFDDLDTVLLLVPLKIMVVGFAWQLGIILFILLGLIYIAWKFYRDVKLTLHGLAPFLYAFVITVFCKAIYLSSLGINPEIPIHIEVLFPAFVLGMIIKLNDEEHKNIQTHEKRLGLIGMVFMLMVGLNMPYVAGELAGYNSSQWFQLSFHVLMITILANIGKLYVLFCYRDEATFSQRLAVGIGMLPRGEVGAGILVMAINMGFSGYIVTLAMASLVLNLILTGVFILLMKLLMNKDLEKNAITT